FPMLIFEGEAFDDFRLTTRFKIVGGAIDQMVGIIFRYQNESNFYLIGATAIGNSFRCYKVSDGEMKPPLGPEMEITKDVCHELVVQTDGNRILGAIDGKEAIKLVDPTSTDHIGKVGFW